MLSHGILKAFAKNRNKGLNFSFLKENGELLQITVSSGLEIESRSLGLYEDMYDKILELCELYPPFFRFFLAITLDLEALGMPGNKGDILSDYVLKHNLFDHETSDTRRWEIINLLARTGRTPIYGYDTREKLEERAHGFFNTPNRFIKFNRPLFYDLTHIIFFWTNYGQHPFEPTKELLQSLTNIGLLSYLDDDLDLLAEVCMCFKFLGQDAPSEWVKTCEAGLDSLMIDFVDASTLEHGASGDEYHIYVVLNWFLAQFGKPAFTDEFKTGIPVFTKNPASKSTLAALSQKLHLETLSEQQTKLKQKILMSDFLTDEQQMQIRRALVCTSHSELFFEKLTNGRIQFH